MATHLAHRLPWSTLADVYAMASSEDNGGRYGAVKTEAMEKQVEHFARCLVDALKEFAATDKRPLTEEDGHSLDPTTWGLEPFGGLGYTGYYYSLLEGYVQLNLLLLDADKFLPVLQRGGTSAPYFIRLLCGHMDGGHPEWIARRLQPIMTSEFGSEIKPFTAEVLQTIRDHCALLFRCLYSISGENKALDPEKVAHTIAPF
ncbi:ATP-dependent RNA helicase DQX1 isoform X2 [Phytophthora cinnamomi]|uniref:ATP-dependent RNA helicase DQX1 isoform X2 n=1 Tax=Phytophthora cinnamomi TaxID=4785 RepID=UPI00355A8DDF|nr:ATP-dependent RNA helicase DQX1 isoform X2 [Phytophthora cinnamomi]